MALLRDLTEEEAKELEKWKASRPPQIQALMEILPPNRLYRLKNSGHRGPIIGYNEDNTVIVAITGQYNRVLFSRNVFGLKPSDLEECDLPGPEEDLGDTVEEAGYTERDIQELLIPLIVQNAETKVH